MSANIGEDGLRFAVCSPSKNICMNFISAEEAVALIKNNERVFIHGGCATPQILVDALTARHQELSNVEITHLHTEGTAPYANPAYAKAFRVNAFLLARMCGHM